MVVRDTAIFPIKDHELSDEPQSPSQLINSAEYVIVMLLIFANTREAEQCPSLQCFNFEIEMLLLKPLLTRCCVIIYRSKHTGTVWPKRPMNQSSFEHFLSNSNCLWDGCRISSCSAICIFFFWSDCEKSSLRLLKKTEGVWKLTVVASIVFSNMRLNWISFSLKCYLFKSTWDEESELRCFQCNATKLQIWTKVDNMIGLHRISREESRIWS